jgi:hypothetical protein
MSDTKTARTYNQTHVPRKYAPGRRRVSMYVAWSYPAEAGRNPSELDNRFSTMTEVRRDVLVVVHLVHRALDQAHDALDQRLRVRLLARLGPVPAVRR